MEKLTLQPIGKVSGTINLPGSKSVSNRALLLDALAKGRTRLTNLLDSDDIRHMLNALTKLGVQYDLSACKTICTVTGLGRAFSVNEKLELFLGNAGTAMRPLCAALCLSEGEFELTGEPRMEERPIGSLVDSLRQAGADVTYLKNEDYDDLLMQNIVYLDLYDTSANNVIVECIVRNTPILINPLPGVKEYLGEDYPLYFNDRSEAGKKADDLGLIRAAYKYLQNHPIKEKLTLEYFVKSFAESKIYNLLSNYMS